MAYKVIRIIDEKSIMLNCGAVQGIAVGDLFYICSKNKEIITDPDTKEILAEMKKYKAKIEVISLYDKICICQNARTSPLLSEALSSALTVRRRLDLNVDPTQITGSFRMDEEEMIQIGDEVEPIPPSLPAQQESPEDTET